MLGIGQFLAIFNIFQHFQNISSLFLTQFPQVMYSDTDHFWSFWAHLGSILGPQEQDIGDTLGQIPPSFQAQNGLIVPKSCTVVLPINIHHWVCFLSHFG